MFFKNFKYSQCLCACHLCCKMILWVRKKLLYVKVVLVPLSSSVLVSWYFELSLEMLYFGVAIYDVVVLKGRVQLTDLFMSLTFYTKKLHINICTFSSMQCDWFVLKRPIILRRQNYLIGSFLISNQLSK